MIQSIISGVFINSTEGASLTLSRLKVYNVIDLSPNSWMTSLKNGAIKGTQNQSQMLADCLFSKINSRIRIVRGNLCYYLIGSYHFCKHNPSFYEPTVKSLEWLMRVSVWYCQDRSFYLLWSVSAMVGIMWVIKMHAFVHSSIYGSICFFPRLSCPQILQFWSFDQVFDPVTKLIPLPKSYYIST